MVEEKIEKGVWHYIFILLMVIFFPIGIIVFLLMKIERLGEELEEQGQEKGSEEV